MKDKLTLTQKVTHTKQIETKIYMLVRFTFHFEKSAIIKNQSIFLHQKIWTQLDTHDIKCTKSPF